MLFNILQVLFFCFFSFGTFPSNQLESSKVQVGGKQMCNNAEKLKNSQLRKEDCQAFIEPDYAVSKQGESFPEILSRYIDEMREVRNIRQKDISDATRIESSLITKYKHGRQKPALYAIKLTPERSTHLLRAAGFTLNDSKEHRIYKDVRSERSIQSKTAMNCSCIMDLWNSRYKILSKPRKRIELSVNTKSVIIKRCIYAV